MAATKATPPAQLRIRRPVLPAAVLLLALPALAAGQEPTTRPTSAPAPLPADPPLAGPPGDANLLVRLSPAKSIDRVWAVSRVTGAEYTPDPASDPNAGRYLFKGMPAAAAYDVCLTTTDGRRLEGADLRFTDQRLLALADARRKQLGLPPEAAHTFTRSDANAIVAYLDGLKDFMDGRRALRIQGHGRRATVLLEAIRASDFHARRNREVIWRVELWYFEYLYGGWDQLAETNRVLHRKRLPGKAFGKLCITFHPGLSACIPAEADSQELRFALPKTADPNAGRVPGEPVKLISRPVVTGLGSTGLVSDPAGEQEQLPAAPANRPAGAGATGDE